MPTVQQEVIQAFLDKLAQSGSIDAQKVAQLRDALAAGQKLRVDDLVKILSAPAGGDLK